jgi:hypothetical protein
LLILLALPLCEVSAINERIPIDAKINGRPVHFAFDTGSEYSLLFRRAAERLGLRITKVDHKKTQPGKVPIDIAEECDFTIGKTQGKATFGVIDTPSYLPLNCDGFIAWSSMSNQVIQLDFERNICGYLDELATDVKSWTKWRLLPNSRVLMFECTNGTETAKIGIDTGLPDGVLLSHKRWEKWRGERAKQAATLSATWFPADGLVVCEVLRARKFTISGLTLDDVPVEVASPSGEIIFEHADLILGLFALKQLKLVVDGKNGVLYTSAIAYPSARYDYNRLGAVFVPKKADTDDDDLVAHVVEGSTAYHAGIRNGDILLKIGELDATKWRIDPRVLPMHRFWSQAADTKLILVLKRNDLLYKTAVILEELPAE